MNNETEYSEDIIKQFLKDELDEQSRSKFEVELLEDESLLQKVQRQEALIDSLRITVEHSASGDAKETIRKTAEPIASLTFFKWLREPLSIAALLIFATSVSLTLPTTTGGVQNIIPVSNNLELGTLRGLSGQEQSALVINVPTLVSVDAGPNPQGLFRVVLVDSKGLTIVSMGQLSANSQGWVQFLLNEKLQGKVKLNLLDSESGELLQEFVLEFSQ